MRSRTELIIRIQMLTSSSCFAHRNCQRARIRVSSVTQCPTQSISLITIDAHGRQSWVYSATAHRTDIIADVSLEGDTKDILSLLCLNSIINANVFISYSDAIQYPLNVYNVYSPGMLLDSLHLPPAAQLP